MVEQFNPYLKVQSSASLAICGLATNDLNFCYIITPSVSRLLKFLMRYVLDSTMQKNSCNTCYINNLCHKNTLHFITFVNRITR